MGNSGLGSLDFPLKRFHRSWIAKSSLRSLTEKKLRIAKFTGPNLAAAYR